jgi:hypothetical protein
VVIGARDPELIAMRLSELMNNFNWLTGNAADMEPAPPSRLDTRALVESTGLTAPGARRAAALNRCQRFKRGPQR